MEHLSIGGVELVAADFRIVDDINVIWMVWTPQNKFPTTWDKAMLKQDVREMTAQDLRTFAEFLIMFCTPIRRGFLVNIFVNRFSGFPVPVEKLYECFVNIWCSFLVSGESWLYWPRDTFAW